MRDSNRPWWQTGVIYQVYPRSFHDSDGDGIGDLNGIAGKLDYLVSLGVDAVWLSPFYRSPMADFGYDVSNHRDVDPIFGTLDDFDRLVTASHQRGLRLIVDFVPNHTSDQHAWFAESRASRVSPKRDWYVWRDPGPDGGTPNNWLSVFGGPAWSLDAASGQYYLHSFLKEQPDLNWRNPEVEAAMFSVLNFWMDRGVDGFRIDVAHAIMKDPAERDNPLSTGRQQAHKSLGEYDSQIHLYDKGHEDVHRVFRDLRRIVDHHNPDRTRVAIAEIHEFDLGAWARYFGDDGDGLHMTFNFGLMKAPWTARGIRQHVEAIERAVPADQWPNYVLGNHDDTRLATRYGVESSRLAAMLLLTLRGTPTLYYGDELGMEETVIPADCEQDPWGLAVPGLGRDGCRTPMPWKSGPQGGFSSGIPWLPLGDPGVNVTAAEAEPDSILHLYRRLLALRRGRKALNQGIFESFDGGDPECFCFVRARDGEQLFVVLNFSSDSRTVTLPEPAAMRIKTSGPATGNLRRVVSLDPWQGAVLEPGKD
jgi:alpha-glucosidase